MGALKTKDLRTQVAILCANYFIILLFVSLHLPHGRLSRALATDLGRLRKPRYGLLVENSLKTNVSRPAMKTGAV